MWFYAAGDGSRKGPLPLETLVAELLQNPSPRDVLVWREGMSGWCPAGSLSELKQKLPPPLPEPIAQQQRAGANRSWVATIGGRVASLWKRDTSRSPEFEAWWNSGRGGLDTQAAIAQPRDGRIILASRAGGRLIDQGRTHIGETEGPIPCPQCHLLNPPGARACDCGYRFATGQVEAPAVAQRHSTAHGQGQGEGPQSATPEPSDPQVMSRHVDSGAITLVALVAALVYSVTFVGQLALGREPASLLTVLTRSAEALGGWAGITLMVGLPIAAVKLLLKQRFPRVDTAVLRSAIVAFLAALVLGVVAGVMVGWARASTKAPSGAPLGATGKTVSDGDWWCP